MMVATKAMAVRAAAGELPMAQVRDAAEDRRDPPARPAHRILDLREGARAIRSVGEGVQQLAHEVAAAVVEARDLAGILHGVVRRVLHAHRRGRAQPLL